MTRWVVRHPPDWEDQRVVRHADVGPSRPGIGAGVKRSVPWWRQGLTTLIVAAVVAPAMLFAVVSTAASSVVPASADMPALPEDLHIVRETVTCGSGGCAREVTIAGPPGVTLEQIAEMLHLPTESCDNNGLLDFKQRCTGVYSVDDEIRLYVSVSDFWK